MTGINSPLGDALRDRYLIERELGQGGMATVYLAQDLKHERPVALKVLQPEYARSIGPDRFLREIRLAARLQHPHILTVFDSGETAGYLWYTMPYVEGESLRDRLRREIQLPVQDAVRLTREIAEALEYAHSQGVIHRDIKPENILLGRNHALVADFGIARTEGMDDQRITDTGIAIGTPAYMSPEQANGGAVDSRTDLYSLGCILYEMLAGEPPFTGPTPQIIAAKRLLGEVPRVSRVRPTVLPTIEEVISRALSPVPGDRWRSAVELSRALSSPGTQLGSGPMEHLQGRRQRKGLVSALALSVALIGALLVWWRLPSMRPNGDELIAVLPFETFGAAQDYFAEGIADEVRVKLVGLDGIQVIARGSSVSYRNTKKSPATIAAELGVRYLLTGTVRWDEAVDGTRRVRVTPELVQVEDGRPTTRWQEAFEVSPTDIFAVQVGIAERVAQSLNLALGDSERERLATMPTRSLPAYEAYLRGEQASSGMSVGDPASLRKAAEHYEQAIALDSTFALAWARLSLARSGVQWTGVPTPEGAEGARRAAERAVALAPSQPDGHMALGSYYRLVLEDYQGAAPNYEAALRLAPDRADMLGALAVNETYLGRWDSAVAHLQRAAILDPRSPAIARRLGSTFRMLRRCPEAEASLDRALALAPKDLAIRQQRLMVDLSRGDLAAARKVLRATPSDIDPTDLVAFMSTFYELYWVLDQPQQDLLLRLSPSRFDDDRGTWGLTLAQAFRLRGETVSARIYADSAQLAYAKQMREAPDNLWLHVPHGLALGMLGRKGEALKEVKLAKLRPLSQDPAGGPENHYMLAKIYLAVDEPERALDVLEALVNVPGNYSPGWLRVDPTFATLKDHPRFKRLVQREVGPMPGT